jgi:hypothetical protein
MGFTQVLFGNFAFTFKHNCLIVYILLDVGRAQCKALKYLGLAITAEHGHDDLVLEAHE